MAQTGGRVDGFICAVGSGGTLAGVSTYLQENKPGVVIGCADPRGAAMQSLFTTGKAVASEGGSVSEGIGLAAVPRLSAILKSITPTQFQTKKPCRWCSISRKRKGYCWVARPLSTWPAPAPRTRAWTRQEIVTILCDHGTRYQSKLYNPDFLRSKNLPVPEWLERKVTILPPFA